MRLPTRIHGVLDYLVGALLIALPFLLDFGAGAQTWVPVALGAAAIVYSLFTDYELGVVKRLQMPAHLWLDGLSGVLLATSPWIFGFDTEVWIPHVALGVLEIAVAVITDTIPGYERRGAR
jgi:hypothetical protein